MKLLDPIERVAQEERPHLVTPVIENQRAPVLVLTLTGIGVFVRGGAVEAREPVHVLRKMTGHPIENHTEPFAMAYVHEVFEVFGRPKPAGRRKKPDHLITPGSRKRMLHDRQEFKVGEAHLL